MPTGGSGACWCQYGTNMDEDPTAAWMNCLLSGIDRDQGIVDTFFFTVGIEMNFIYCKLKNLKKHEFHFLQA